MILSKKEYPDSKLLLSDTDYLYYEVESPTFEKELFAYSDYPEKSESFNESRKRVI